MVLIVFGSFMVIRAYCTGVDLKWTAPFHPITVQPYGVVATMTFQRLDKGYPDWKSVRNSAGGGATPLPPAPPGERASCVARRRPSPRATWLRRMPSRRRRRAG